MSTLKDYFFLDPNITFLNFGSFGATPKPILAKYQSLQVEMERNPVEFYARTGITLLADARDQLGSYINCDAEDVVFTTNPSYAINAIAASIRLKKGDEILSTNIEYGALEKAWHFHCSKTDSKFIQQEISLPIKSKEDFLTDFWKGFSSKTKAIFISQITSATGLILPVKEICEEAKRRNLLTIVDGAHVPGHIPLDLQKLEADLYTGACHKWMMAPKGCSFLYAKKEQQSWIDPLVISWGFNNEEFNISQFIDYHQMNGTRDYTAFLSLPACINFMDTHNWKVVSKECNELVLKYGPKLCEMVGSKPLAPLTPEFYGQLFSIPIKTDNPVELQQTLFNRFKIEIPVMVQNDKVYIRYSINAFNSEEDLEVLKSAIETLIEEGVIKKNKQ